MTHSGRILGALLAAVCVLVVCELALGAWNFGETDIADSCTSQARFEGGGIDGALQRFALSAISGAACELGVSREELVLSLVPSTSGKVRWDKATINRALRYGVRRAAKDTTGNPFLSALLEGVLDKILADPLAWLLNQSA
jgi:hypothetical protein